MKLTPMSDIPSKLLLRWTLAGLLGIFVPCTVVGYLMPESVPLSLCVALPAGLAGMIVGRDTVCENG